MEWSYLTTVSDQIGAEMLVQRLQEEGIPAIVHPGDTGSYPHLVFGGLAAAPCRVMVAADRWEEATALLESWEGETPEG